MSDFDILERIVRDLDSSVNLYFNPPTSTLIRYPAVRCVLKSIDNVHANDDVYGQKTAYQLTFICKELGDMFVKKLSLLKYCSFDRHYVADNLNHYVFTLYI